jgi:hypothetical protein
MIGNAGGVNVVQASSSDALGHCQRDLNGKAQTYYPTSHAVP